ncbi:zinc-binding alcohol dehydrogenase family protein [Panacibacter ginsenosidivorans]|uniref:Zinc-binding alcohol dehydrogenase family protein n=1 Tax=Panacibacter ginsenosidivorans TaxID=1813871 RepID=A0A5B8VD45_9BACT|nr:zinc-binding alcohol dehydrogenase family protein [Panacibacter ginsenosidivorans]QEC69384.1 zinc-binding alcohol dehydrogenase family protein [Panacibacter ginsenosidivorans]
MKALVCVEPGLFKYEEVDKPALNKDHALLKIKRIGVCGTDLHAYEGTQPYFNYPRILGHELAAEIAEINSSSNFTIGETVTIIPYFNCGNCIACRNGKTNCCVSMKVCGVHTDGGMMEYLSVPVSSLVHSNGLTLDELALVEPLAIGAHGIRRANVQPNEFVLVIGAGPIGLGTMEFAKIAGAKVIAMDVNEQRLFFCEQNLSVDYTINAVTENVRECLIEITGGDMPAVIVDATGNLKAINNAFQYLAHGGRYVLIGLQKSDISFSHPEFHKREATLMSSRNATRADFEHVMESMKDGLVRPSTYITHRVGFSEVKNVFASWLDPANAVIKAMIEM